MKYLKGLLFLFFLLIAAAGIWLYRSLEVVNPEAEPVLFSVAPGESLYSVLERLEEKELIKDARPYKIYSRLRHGGFIKQGIYSLSAAQGGFEIMKLLQQGQQELVKVTIPEGLTARETARILEGKGIVDSRDFLLLIHDADLLKKLGIPGDSAEGYLFPDTYYFQRDFPPGEVLSFMVKTCFSTMEKIFPFYKDLTKEKLQEKIILASIVEKEYRLPSEASLIASVFYNRLRIGMPLQSCATIIYIITEELGKAHPGRLYFRDLELPSKSNTYRNPGLPPVPISNPGKTALNAVFNPAQSDYLYFVVKDASAGSHNFSSSLADHNRARADYLNGFRSK